MTTPNTPTPCPVCGETGPCVQPGTREEIGQPHARRIMADRGKE